MAAGDTPLRRLYPVQHLTERMLRMSGRYRSFCANLDLGKVDRRGDEHPQYSLSVQRANKH
jgi:hypothetical protein